MKKRICLLLAICMVFALAACGKQAEPEIREWTRQGYFMDENENILSVTWMDDVDEPGWYVGVMLGEDLIEDSWGGMLLQDGNTLRGSLPTSGSKGDRIVTISEEGEDGLILTVEGGETYRFKGGELPTANVIVTVNTEGWGYIAYAEGEDTPEIDTEYPAQSAYIGLAGPAVHTFVAWPQVGNVFVKWTKNGEDFSTEPQFTVLLDESAEYVAVFEEDPDWLNPVIYYAGEYQCDRAHAAVMCAGFEDAWITIEWGSSAWELTRWDIFGTLDTDTQAISYSGCTKSNLVYDDNGELKTQETVYEGGTGTIVFNGDGTFTWHEDQSESGEDMVFGRLPFAYEHDPRENPEAMKDVVENADAVYGFSPDPESTRLGAYAEYDWTDPAFVAKAQEERRAYHESMDSMTDILYRMREEGASIEEMARAVSEERNRLRLAAHDNDPEGLAEVKKSNLETYGHEEGPMPDELFEKYGSWTVVLQKAFSPNMGMDACCGLYDEYYWLYIELGYVEDESVGMANPWVEITEEEANAACPQLFRAPDGTETQTWMLCEDLADPATGVGPMIQLSFVQYGMNFTARAQEGAGEDADISGLYTDWTVGPEVVILANWGDGKMSGKMYRAINDTGYIDLITWYDPAADIKYSLSVAAADLDGFDIQAVAEQMCTEKKQ